MAGEGPDESQNRDGTGRKEILVLQGAVGKASRGFQYLNWVLKDGQVWAGCRGLRIGGMERIPDITLWFT